MWPCGKEGRQACLRLQVTPNVAAMRPPDVAAMRPPDVRLLEVQHLPAAAGGYPDLDALHRCQQQVTLLGKVKSCQGMKLSIMYEMVSPCCLQVHRGSSEEHHRPILCEWRDRDYIVVAGRYLEVFFCIGFVNMLYGGVPNICVTCFQN